MNLKWGLSFSIWRKRNNCVFLIKIKGTEKSLLGISASSLPRVIPQSQAREVLGQRKERVERKPDTPPASLACLLALSHNAPVTDNHSASTLLHSKRWPCMSSPLRQKLRVKMQGKQTFLCLENAGPSLACQYLSSLYFLPPEPLFGDNG